MENWIDMQAQHSQEGNDELQKSFIGKNYEKILNRKFLIPPIFFGPFYFAYRKMFAIATIFSIISIIVSTFITNVLKNNMLSFFVGIILNVISAFVVNKLYKIHTKKKIEKIINQNPGKTNE